MDPQGPVAILWDIENCAIPSDVQPADVAINIRKALGGGAVTTFSAYGDFSSFPKTVREGCQRTGVKLVDVPNGRKDAADKAILVDMFLFALDNRPPSSVVLISGDVDFSQALHILGQRGYTIILVIPSGVRVSSVLRNAGQFVWDWPSVARGVSSIPSTRPSALTSRMGSNEISNRPMGCQSSENQDALKNEEAFGHHTLSRLLPGLGYSDQILVDRFYRGLSPRLQYGMRPVIPTSLQECYPVASVVEITCRRRDALSSQKRKDGPDTDDAKQGSSNKRNKPFQKGQRFNQGKGNQTDGNLLVPYGGAAKPQRSYPPKGSGYGSNRGQKFVRHFYCKQCEKDHPGVDCLGEKVQCHHCQLWGHRAFECIRNPESKNYRPGAKANTGQKSGAGDTRPPPTNQAQGAKGKGPASGPALHVMDRTDEVGTSTNPGWGGQAPLILHVAPPLVETPQRILDRKTRDTRNKTVSLVKVLWSNHDVEEATWELEADMRAKFPSLFTNSTL